MLLQLTKGLAHLHRMNIIHRDIKPANILIFILKSGEFVKPQIKLADFGLSHILKAGAREEKNINAYGTRGWMAPEMYNSESLFGLKADIFPLGCVFGYTLTKGKHPFGKNPMEIQHRIEQGIQMMSLVADDLNTPQSDNRSAFELIKSMLNHDPIRRPSAEEILDSTFFRKQPAGQLQENSQGKNIDEY